MIQVKAEACARGLAEREFSVRSCIQTTASPWSQTAVKLNVWSLDEVTCRRTGHGAATFARVRLEIRYETAKEQGNDFQLFAGPYVGPPSLHPGKPGEGLDREDPFGEGTTGGGVFMLSPARSKARIPERGPTCSLACSLSSRSVRIHCLWFVNHP